MTINKKKCYPVFLCKWSYKQVLCWLSGFDEVMKQAALYSSSQVTLAHSHLTALSISLITRYLFYCHGFPFCACLFFYNFLLIRGRTIYFSFSYILLVLYSTVYCRSSLMQCFVMVAIKTPFLFHSLRQYWPFQMVTYSERFHFT